MVNFYHRFVPRAAELIFPLYEALRGEAAKQVLNWIEERTKAFEGTKCALVNTTLLAHPQPDAPIALTMDASNCAVGAIHDQLVDGVWQLLAF
ncbi:hypothetical protein LDENG_00205840 [Lucifuga dentata]|nr:hypothetical protein LDENG_00205840 [Lucifuga dentata]